MDATKFFVIIMMTGLIARGLWVLAIAGADILTHRDNVTK